MLDAKVLKPGEGFESLPETYVIFFTENDYYKKNKPVYHIDRNILEIGLSFRDAQHIIYVNGQNRSDTPLGKMIQDFWCTDPKDMHYDALREAVSYFKDTEKGRETVCRELEAMREEYRQKGKSEGLAEGRVEGRAEGIAEGTAKGEESTFRSMKTFKELYRSGKSREEIMAAMNCSQEKYDTMYNLFN